MSTNFGIDGVFEVLSALIFLDMRGRRLFMSSIAPQKKSQKTDKFTIDALVGMVSMI